MGIAGDVLRTTYERRVENNLHVGRGTGEWGVVADGEALFLGGLATLGFAMSADSGCGQLEK